MERKLKLHNTRFCFVTDEGKVFNEIHKELKMQVDKVGQSFKSNFRSDDTRKDTK